MRLTKFQVKEYCSVRDSNPIEVDGITCLVGKNEAGKTALLEALRRIKPVTPVDGFNVTHDYPRSDVIEYEKAVESGRREPATVIEVTFALDDEDMSAAIEEYGEGLFSPEPTVTISAGYYDNQRVAVTVNEGAAIATLLSHAQLPANLAKAFRKAKTIGELQDLVDNHDDADTAEHVERLRTIIAPIVKDDRSVSLHVYRRYLRERVPSFLYFDEFFMMRGRENIQKLKQRLDSDTLEDSDYPLLGLISLARLDIDQLMTPGETQKLKNQLEGAANHLTKQVLKHWTQNKHLRMQFDAREAQPEDPEDMRQGTNIWGEVYDNRHQATTQLSRRSRGFVWFFSFLAWYSQQKDEHDSLVLLLDEPGLFLHALGQNDLLRFIETELAEQHQVIYTTHSPFMVDPEHLERVQIVQDRTMDEDNVPANEEGTKVFSDWAGATDDSLFPLQGALGYEIHQTLFVGPNSLVVEGASDLLYLQAVSGILESAGRTGLDPRWTITPVGGSDKVPTFVALLGAQKRMKIATLIDLRKKDLQTIENLYKKKLLKKKNVLTFADFTGGAEADIEDMLGEDFYVELVNAEYASVLKSPISVADLPSGSRILARLETYLADSPLTEGQFSHYRAARYFASTESMQKRTPDAALDRFEEAFKALNSLLK